MGRSAQCRLAPAARHESEDEWSVSEYVLFPPPLDDPCPCRSAAFAADVRPGRLLARQGPRGAAVLSSAERGARAAANARRPREPGGNPPAVRDPLRAVAAVERASLRIRRPHARVGSARFRRVGAGRAIAEAPPKAA